MTSQFIRPAYTKWPDYNRAWRDVVAELSDELLAVAPGHGGGRCGRRSGTPPASGSSGCATLRVRAAPTRPFPNAGSNCPGDDDLEHVLSATQLAAALDSTFPIVERCLDTWTLDSLGEIVRHPESGAKWAYSLGSIIQRVFAHDVSHIAELNEALSRAGRPQVDLWD